MEHRHAGLGFWIRQNRTNEGFATDAASRRIAEKLGCSLEGILRRRLILPAGPTDTFIYAILREDL